MHWIGLFLVLFGLLFTIAHLAQHDLNKLDDRTLTADAASVSGQDPIQDELQSQAPVPWPYLPSNVLVFDIDNTMVHIHWDNHCRASEATEIKDGPHIMAHKGHYHWNPAFVDYITSNMQDIESRGVKIVLYTANRPEVGHAMKDVFEATFAPLKIEKVYAIDLEKDIHKRAVGKDVYVKLLSKLVVDEIIKNGHQVGVIDDKRIWIDIKSMFFPDKPYENTKQMAEQSENETISIGDVTFKCTQLWIPYYESATIK